MDKKVLLAFACGAVLSTAVTTATAHEAGDMIIRAGIASVNPDESMSGVLDALDAKVDDNQQLGLTFTYMLTDSVAVEVLAATPFKHEVDSSAGVIAETKHLPPTVSLQYFLMDNSSKFQPYVGVGLNYTTFFSENGKGILDGADVEFDDSFGLTAQIGMDYKISENMYLNAAVWRMDIETDVTVEGIGDAGTATLDPWVYMLGVGWKF